MNRHFLFGLVFLLLGGWLSAQVTIFGQVSFGQEDGPGIPNWPIEVFLANGNEAGTATTGDDGFYELDLGVSFSDPSEVAVRTMDICTGGFVTTPFEVIPGQAEYFVNLIICAGIDPPPPTECAPYFYYEQVPSDEGFAIHFFDISHPGEEGITSWSWSFGDGGSSNEQNPVHVYAEEGFYEVSLSISGEDCEATIIQVVTVYNQGNCDCPTDEYDPVCVFTPSGAVLEFVSPCYAECAGYGPEVYTACDGNVCGCPEFYAPVCITSPDGVTIEFQNHCFAECEGYGPDQWEDCGNECNCPQYYDPVCVINDLGHIVTFDNPCFAECAGYGADQFVDCEDECGCEDGGAPVCVGTPFGVMTFPNTCEAECAGYGPGTWLDGCGESCFCDDVWEPVCVVTDEGYNFTFTNPCEAACYGFDEFVECEENCVCPQVYSPVCVIDPATGESIEFMNSCYAECEGYGPDQYENCHETCNCPTVWDPVCVNGFAGIITFPNACYAECEGFGPEYYVDCNEDCVCDTVWDPVCVATPDGLIITFSNACIAACEGFTPDQFVDCGNGNECYVAFSYLFYDDTELGHRVTFTDESFAVGGVTSWFWDFGDGATSTEQNPEHTYDQEGGVFSVTLTIESPECGTISTTYHLCVGEGGVVSGPACESFFFFEQPNVDDLLTFQFIDFSLGDIDAWIWDFGDGTTSTEQNPTHTYTTEGPYLVSLTVISDNCESSIQISITAGTNVWYGDLACRAWFLPMINPATLEVYFINLSSADAVQFEWDFGDGNTSTNPLAFHGYEAPGVYTVTLTTTSANGCTNTFSVTINLSGEEDGFTSNPVFSLVSSTEEPTSLKILKAAPNPTSNLVQLSWEVAKAGDYSWQLFDLNGKLLQQQTLRSVGGTNQVELDLSRHAAGIYLFRLQTPEGQQTLRLSKL